MDLLLQAVSDSPGSIAVSIVPRTRTDQTSLLLLATGEVTLTYHVVHFLSSATLCALGFIMVFSQSKMSITLPVHLTHPFSPAFW